jgi:hypothetical protein
MRTTERYPMAPNRIRRGHRAVVTATADRGVVPVVAAGQDAAAGSHQEGT